MRATTYSPSSACTPSRSSRRPDLFDVDHVEVNGGLIQPAGMPRHRFFLWTDPEQKHDLVVFLGEAQPPIGKFAFCQRSSTLPAS